MGVRSDLSNEKKETEIPLIFTEASDIDEALELAWSAVRDAKSFQAYATRGMGVI